MYPNRAGGAAAYARVGVESDVLSASPHRLITLLFEGADKAIRSAGVHMRDGNKAEKGKAISKALDIVNRGLLAALDRERGGELAERMALLYDYIARLLLKANLHDDAAALEEARHLLGELGSAWREIDTDGK
ncbi:flagellar export chaperone FliS [Microbulbifer thermotolerans]|uniref:Flagellar secretion chaperone FliS n=1 Tax=Microbulbifer thermotolerans TaxID=252514 RepID=A0A143HNT3_MICTH|nr:flagellar export chaperone FliS [Microbulbifer thermotolerans]AMX03161.1 flagellar protein FliS [Microbulbifer thermotolerans]MCX2783462.1 flagellar export chaperone FliS [Microbulbifer thermotolerans]MCX2835514.1 flagellar export chaperone FliS [Microbulbifer thermotolerans]SFC62685.1 flagellar protein FliS [Microbulbifer thermotolerans]